MHGWPALDEQARVQVGTPCGWRTPYGKLKQKSYIALEVLENNFAA